MTFSFFRAFTVIKQTYVSNEVNFKFQEYLLKVNINMLLVTVFLTAGIVYIS